MTTADTPVAFDPLEPGFSTSPYEQYDRLRAADPVHYSTLLHGWILTRYDDVARILRDPSVSSDLTKAAPTPLTEAENALRAELAGGREGSGDGDNLKTVVLTDEPDHSRLRRLLQGPFSARSVEARRGLIERHVAEALDALDDRGDAFELDLIDDFAYPLPVSIFCDMLGFPAEDSPRFRYWTQCVARNLDPLLDRAERAECLTGTIEMNVYLDGQIAEIRQHPRDDVLTELVLAEDGGDTLSGDELLAQLVTLYVAGHEPTTSVIGNGMHALLRQPDELAKLRARPDLMRNAVAEFMRFDGPNQFVRRVTTEPFTLSDVEIPAGAVVYPSPAAANRDPEFWGDDVNRIRVDRPEAPQHLQLGAGIHACLGSHLARLQVEIAMAALLERFSEIELAGDPTWSERMVIRSMDQLPLRVRLA